MTEFSISISHSWKILIILGSNGIYFQLDKEEEDSDDEEDEDPDFYQLAHMPI